MSMINRIPPRTAALIALASVSTAAIAGATLATGAAASTTETTTATASTARGGTAQGMAEIWAETTPATQDYLCTAYLASPDGTWQTLAPVLTAHGVTHADAAEHLAAACSPEQTVAALHR